MIEYVLIAAAISVIAIPIVPGIGTAVSNAWSGVSTPGVDAARAPARSRPEAQETDSNAWSVLLRLCFQMTVLLTMLERACPRRVRPGHDRVRVADRGARRSSASRHGRHRSGDLRQAYQALDTQHAGPLGAATARRRRVVTAFQIAALAVGVAACVTDVVSRRVPNRLTGVAVDRRRRRPHPAAGRAGRWSHAAIGMLVGLAVFFPFFALGGMGGGDVKLMAALGAWLGWSANRLDGALRRRRRRRDGASRSASRTAICVRRSRILAACCCSGRPRACGRCRPSPSNTGAARACPMRMPDLRGPGGDAMATLTRKPRWHSERGAELDRDGGGAAAAAARAVRDHRLRVHVPALRRADQRRDGGRAGGHPAQLHRRPMPRTGPNRYAATGGIPGTVTAVATQREPSPAGRRHAGRPCRWS